MVSSVNPRYRTGALVRRAETVLGMSRRTVYRWLKAGVVTEEGLREFLRECREVLLTPRQAAEALGVSRKWLYALVDRGRLVAVRLEPFGTIWVKQSEVESFIVRFSARETGRGTRRASTS